MWSTTSNRIFCKAPALRVPIRVWEGRGDWTPVLIALALIQRSLAKRVSLSSDQILIRLPFYRKRYPAPGGHPLQQKSVTQVDTLFSAILGQLQKVRRWFRLPGTCLDSILSCPALSGPARSQSGAFRIEGAVSSEAYMPFLPRRSTKAA